MRIEEVEEFCFYPEKDGGWVCTKLE